MYIFDFIVYFFFHFLGIKKWNENEKETFYNLFLLAQFPFQDAFVA